MWILFFLLQKFVFDCWHAVLETAGQQLLVSLKKSLWRPLDEYEYDVLVVDKRFRNDQTRTNSQIDCFLFCWVHVNVDVDLLAVWQVRRPAGTWIWACWLLCQLALGQLWALVFLDGINGHMGKQRNRVGLGNRCYEFWLVSLVLILQPCSTWVQFFKLWLLEAPSWCDFKEFDVRNNSQVCLPEKFVVRKVLRNLQGPIGGLLWHCGWNLLAFPHSKRMNQQIETLPKKNPTVRLFFLGFHPFKHPLEPTFTKGFSMFPSGVEWFF